MSVDPSLFIRNVYYLSSLARFNSERFQLIMRFYDSSMSSGDLFRREISLQDIREFAKNLREAQKRRGDMKKAILEETLLTIPGASNVNWSMTYAVERYSSIDSALLEEAGFSIRSLVTLEGVIVGSVELNARCDKLLSEVHQFTGVDYVDLDFVAEPCKVFESKWSWCITLSEDEITKSFAQTYSSNDASIDALSSSAIRVDSEEGLLNLRLLELKKALDFLSRDAASTESKPFDFVTKPLVRCRSETNATYYIAPFPMLLGSTTQIRVENLIRGSERLRKEDEASKGKKVEKLASSLLFDFPNVNLVKNLKYKIGEQNFETDILLILESSLWAVEIKSHPLFRKIPLEIDKVVPVYAEKVLEGVDQGKRALNWLSQRDDLLRSLNCRRNSGDVIKGIIVLLDGFMPTLLTQNERNDGAMFGTDIIYDQINEPVRIYVLTVAELYTLSMQYDKESFERFLIWRTGYFRKMPLIAYEEKEYWAFFNNPKNKELLDNFPKMIEKENTIVYTSGRFSNKDYRKEMDKRKDADESSSKGEDRFDLAMFYCPRCNEVFRPITKNYKHGLDITGKKDDTLRLIMSLVTHYCQCHASTREKAFSLLVEDRLLRGGEGVIGLGDSFLGFGLQITKDEAKGIKSKKFLRNLEELKSFLVTRAGMSDKKADTLIAEIGRRLEESQGKS